MGTKPRDLWRVVVRPEIKDRAILLICCLVVLAAPARTGRACTPESYFLFRSEAQVRLDSLNAQPTHENALERLILMHNLAFHKNKQQREKAEKLLKKQFPKKQRSPIISAYAGSLKMIKVSHRTTGSKVIRTLNPLTKSPYAEGREGYRQISGAVAQDTASTVLRILRATAAAESAEHLHELSDSARIDLEWLQTHKKASDSVWMFLIHLNWAKYHSKLAKRNQSDVDRTEAARHAELALSFACTPVYRLWADEWQSRIRDLRTTDSGRR